jgi:hypothetical protein
MGGLGDGVQTFKSVFGVARAALPVLYCGGLLYYFLDVSGSVQEAQDIGLGPTVLGLGAVGVLFSIPLILKVVRLVGKPRSPGGGPPKDDDDDDGGAAADAAIARYLARKSAEAAATPPARPAPQNSAPARRPSFGRKSG